MAAADNAPRYGYAPAPAYKAAPAYEEPAVYAYTYAVADDYSGSNFGADEQRDGLVASGSYFVNLPDSRVQKVNLCTPIPCL